MNKPYYILRNKNGEVSAYFRIDSNRMPEFIHDYQNGAMGNTIKVLHELTPIGVAMAGDETFDPYKD